MVGIDFGDDLVEFALGNVARDAFVEQAPVVLLEPEAQPFEIGRTVGWVERGRAADSRMR